VGALWDNGFNSYAAACAILLFSAGAWLFLKRLRLSLGDRAQGEITGYVTRMRPRAVSKTMFMPKVRYGCLQHGRHEFVSRMSADPESWPVGTRVPVAFSAADPAGAEIATLARLWLAPLAFWILAAGMVGVALKA